MSGMEMDAETTATQEPTVCDEAVKQKEIDKQIGDALLEARAKLFSAVELMASSHDSEELLTISKAINLLNNALI